MLQEELENELKFWDVMLLLLKIDKACIHVLYVLVLYMQKII